MAKVLVTGADGFVGRALVPQLLAAGHAVTPVSRIASSDARVAIGDIGRYEAWPTLLADVDVIVHLAGRAHVVRETVAEPLSEFRRVNVAATLQLATVAARCGVRRFIFMSSIGVNGSRTVDSSFSESDEPAPTDAYAISKWEAEQGLVKISSKEPMEITRLRPPLIIGPGAKGNLRRLMGLVDTGIPLPFGAVRNSRSFVALDDMCNFIVMCVSHERARGELFLVADQEEVSTADLVNGIAENLGRRPHLISVPLPILRLLARAAHVESELQRMTWSLRVSADRARDILGWTPKTGIREATRAMVAAYLREKQQ